MRKIPARKILFLIFGTSCASATAFAENALGFYFGAGVGESEVRRDGYYGPYFDEHHFAWKAIAGIRPISPVGVQLEYIDFGNPSAGPNYNFRSANSDAKAGALFGVGYLPLPVSFLDIFGKLGVARLHSNTTAIEPGLCPPYLFCPAQLVFLYQQNQWSTDFAYGAGAQAKFGAIVLLAEYERIAASGGNPDLFSVGVSWTF